jgi:hypothetical protein
LKIVLHALTTKEEGLSPLPKALQMYESKTTFVELKFTQISCSKNYLQVYKQEQMNSPKK